MTCCLESDELDNSVQGRATRAEPRGASLERALGLRGAADDVSVWTVTVNVPLAFVLPSRVLPSMRQSDAMGRGCEDDEGGVRLDGEARSRPPSTTRRTRDPRSVS